MIKTSRFLQTLNNQMDHNLISPLTTDEIRRLLLVPYHLLGEKKGLSSRLISLRDCRWVLSGTNALETLSLQKAGDTGHSPHSFRDLKQHNSYFTCKLFMSIYTQPEIFTIFTKSILWFEHLPTLFKEGSIHPISSA